MSLQKFQASVESETNGSKAIMRKRTEKTEWKLKPFEGKEEK